MAELWVDSQEISMPVGAGTIVLGNAELEQIIAACSQTNEHT